MTQPTAPRERRLAFRRQRGLGTVGLLVGLGLGLSVSAMALVMLGAQLRGLRELQLQMLLQRELRLLTRQIETSLLHTGYDNQAHLQAGEPTGLVELQSGASSDQLVLRHGLWMPDDRLASPMDQRGFRLRNQTLQTLIAGSWQPLNDPNQLIVSTLRFSLKSAQWTRPGDCPCASGTHCTLRLHMRRIQVSLSAELRQAPNLRETTTLSLPLPNPPTERLCT